MLLAWKKCTNRLSPPQDVSTELKAEDQQLFLESEKWGIRGTVTAFSSISWWNSGCRNTMRAFGRDTEFRELRSRFLYKNAPTLVRKKYAVLVKCLVRHGDVLICGSEHCFSLPTMKVALLSCRACLRTDGQGLATLALSHCFCSYSVDQAVFQEPVINEVNVIQY